MLNTPFLSKSVLPIKRKYKKIQYRKTQFTQNCILNRLLFFKNLLFIRIFKLKIKRGNANKCFNNFYGEFALFKNKLLLNPFIVWNLTSPAFENNRSFIAYLFSKKSSLRQRSGLSPTSKKKELRLRHKVNSFTKRVYLSKPRFRSLIVNLFNVLSIYQLSAFIAAAQGVCLNKLILKKLIRKTNLLFLTTYTLITYFFIFNSVTKHSTQTKCSFITSFSFLKKKCKNRAILCRNKTLAVGFRENSKLLGVSTEFYLTVIRSKKKSNYLLSRWLESKRDLDCNFISCMSTLPTYGILYFFFRPSRKHLLIIKHYYDVNFLSILSDLINVVMPKYNYKVKVTKTRKQFFLSNWPMLRSDSFKTLKNFEFFINSFLKSDKISLSDNLFNLLSLNHPFYSDLSELYRATKSRSIPSNLFSNYKW